MFRIRTECTRRSTTPPIISNYNPLYVSQSSPDFMLMASSGYPTISAPQRSILSSQYNSPSNYPNQSQPPHHNYHHHQHPSNTSSSHHLSFMTPPSHPHNFTQFRPMLGLAGNAAIVDQLPAGLTAFCKWYLLYRIFKQTNKAI